MATNSMPELEGSVSAQPATLGDSFYAQLQQARTEATNNFGYSSEETRKSISDEILAHSGGKIPYAWQVDISEAVYLGLDVALMAGTGAGKTWTFLGIFLAYKTSKSKIIVVSPLNELQKDQVCGKCTCVPCSSLHSIVEHEYSARLSTY
jgi:ATP-dependent helicase YprA (DUF1998 family)